MEDYLNKYDWVAPFNQGVAIVVKDNKYGAILTGGQEILAPFYEYISSFNNGFAQAIKNGQCVIVDLSGSECKQCGNKIIRVPKEYDVVRDFKDGLACVQKNGEWGVIDTDCKEIFPPKFFYISDFVKGTAKYKLNNGKSWGFLNSDGFCSDCNMKKEPEIETDGTLIIERYEKTNELNEERVKRIIRIDNKGNIIVKNGDNDVSISNEYHIARDFYCGVACVQNQDGYWGAVNELGEVIFPFEYLSIQRFKHERSFACDKNKQLCLLSSTGSVIKIFEFSWDSHNCRPFDGDYAIIDNGESKNKKYGLIDKSGEEMLRIAYDRIINIDEDHTLVHIKGIGECCISLDGKSFFIDNQTILLPVWCIGIKQITDELFSALSYDGKWGIISKEGKTLCGPIYDEIKEVLDDMIVGEEHIIERHGWSSKDVVMYGLYNVTSGVTIPAIYDEIPKIEDNYYIIKKDGLCGLLRLNGDEFLKPEYEEITYDNKGYFIVSKRTDDGIQIKQGLLNTHGETVIAPLFDIITIIKKGLYRICEKRWKRRDVPTEWALFNNEGQISKEFDEMDTSVKNGLIKVKKYGKSGFINENGSIVIHSDNKKAIELPGKFSWGEDFKDGISAVWINGVMNYVDEDFNIVINNNGRAIKILTDIDYVISLDSVQNYLFSYQEKLGLLSKDGRLLISPRFDSLTPFSDNLYLASINEKRESEQSYEYFGLMTTNNEEVLSLIYKSIEPFDKIMERDRDQEDAESSTIPNVKSDSINYWVIEKGYNEKGLIDKAGNICLEAIYNSIEHYENLFIVERNTESHTSESIILDENFNVKLQLKGSISSTKKLGRLFWIKIYSESHDFESYILDEVFNVKLQIRDSVYSIEPYDGKVHIFFTDDDEDYSYGLNDTKVPDPIVPSKEQKYWLLKAYRYGLIDDNGNNCINAIYRNIVQFEHGFYVKQGDKWGILNEDFEVVTEPKYDSIENYRDGYKKVIKKNNIYDDDEYFLDNVKTEGIIDEFGQEIVEPIYHKIFACDEENVSIVVSNKEDCNLYGLINKTYEFIVQPEFSYISTFHDGKAYARKRQDAPGWSEPVFQCGYLDTDGEFSDFFDLIDVQNGIYPDRIKVIGTTRDDLTIIQIIDSKPDNQYCAIINQEGEVIVPFVYHIIESCQENTYKAGIIDHSTCVWYLLNINFIELTHEACKSISLIQHSYVVTTRDGKAGLINHQGAALLPFDYSSIVDAGNNRLWIEEFHKKSLYDDDIYGYDHNTTGKYGLASLDGQILVEPKYHSVEPFIDGRAIVRCSYNEYGVIDMDGNEIIPLKYHYIKYDSEKKQFVVTKNFPNNSYIEQYKEGRFNIDGFHIIKGADGNDIITSKKYDWQEDYDENFCSIVYKDGKKGIVNTKFQLIFNIHSDESNDNDSVFVLPEEYDWGTYSSNDFIIVEKNNKYGVLKTDYTLIIDCLYDKIESVPNYHGLFLCATLNVKEISDKFNHNDFLWALVNKDDLRLCPSLPYTDIKFIGNSFIAIKYDGKYTIYDSCGHEIIDEKFDVVMNFSVPSYAERFYHHDDYGEKDSLFAIVGKDEKFGIINRLGEIVVPMIYDKLSLKENNQFEGDGVLMNLLGQRIVTDNKQTISIPEEYEGVQICHNGLIIVRQNDKYGCITQANTIVIPAIYNKLKCYNHYFVASLLIDEKENPYMNYYYDSDYRHEDGHYYKTGVINYSNEVVIPFEVDYKEFVICDNLIKYKVNKRWGAFTLQGIKICEPKYNYIEYLTDDLIKVGKNREVRISDDDGWYYTRDYDYNGIEWGIINFKGNDVLPVKYDEIGDVDDSGRVLVQDGCQKGFVDIMGNVLLEPTYSTIGSFIDGFAIVSKECFDYQEYEEYSVYGVIDCSYKEVIPCVFRKIQYVEELGLFKTEKGYKTPDGRGVVELNGTKIVVHKKYAYCSNFNNGCAIATRFVDKKKRYGLINTKSEDILPPVFPSLQYMDFGLYVFKLNGKWGIVNGGGNILLPNLYDGIGKFDGDLAMITIKNNVTNKGEIDATLYGYINSKGETVLPAEFSFIGKRNESYSVIRKGLDGTWGLFNRDSQEFKLIENAAYIGPCKDGLCLINVGGHFDSVKKKTDGGKWGYIFADGKEALSPVDYLGIRSDNYSVIRKDKTWGLFNLATSKVKMIKKASYLGPYKDGLCLINIGGVYDQKKKKANGGKWGYINIEGKTILPALYDFIGKRSENYSVIRKDRSWALFNLVTHEVKEIEEASCLGPCIDGLCRINVGGSYDIENKKINGGQWGYLAPGKGIVIDSKFSNAHDFSDGMAAVKIDDKWGFINTNGDMIVPCEYDELISSYTDGKGKLCRNDYLEVFDKDGKNISSQRRRYYGDDDGYDDYVGFDDYDTPTYDKYGGPGGYSDQTIDEAFDGDPSLLSNID